MACYHPIPAIQETPGAQVKLYPGRPGNLALPCGTCIGCKSARAQLWAVRCQHEAERYNNSIFLTLTYDDEHLPLEGYLDALAFQKFLKRLRKRAQSDPNGLGCTTSTTKRVRLGNKRNRRWTTKEVRDVRYFACGEYGDSNGRPHYHAILFNCKPRPDYRITDDQYESHIFNELWPYGKHTWGEATPAAANYIAQYTLKKQHTRRHQRRNEGYQGQHYSLYWDGVTDDGEEISWGPEQRILKPAPFLRLSLKPAIGAHWLDKYKTDLQHGYLVTDGHKTAIPRTYLERLKLHHTELAKDIIHRKKQHLRHNTKEDNNNPERRKAAEAIHKRRKQLTEQRNI